MIENKEVWAIVIGMIYVSAPGRRARSSAFRRVGAMLIPATALLLTAIVGCGGRRAPEVAPVDRTLDLPPACIRFEREALRDLDLSDSLLVTGQAGLALERYAGLQRLYPDCAVLHARLADASRVLDREEPARDHYEAALALDRCDVAARAGLVELRFPDDPRSSGRIAALRRLLATGDDATGSGPATPVACPPGAATLGLGWRLAILAGDSLQADQLEGWLRSAAPYSPEALAYGQNLVGDAPDGSVLVCGTRLEADLALAAPGGRARGVTVVDLGLLDHPAYARHLARDGLDFGLTDAALADVGPFWSDERGRTLSVAEVLLGRLLRGSRPVVLSGAIDHPLLLDLRDRLVVVGLVQRVVSGRGGVSPSSVDRAASGWTFPEPGSAGAGRPASILEEVTAVRLWTRHAEVALLGARAALRRGDPVMGARLLDVADRVLSVRAGRPGLRERVAELRGVAG